MRIGFDIPAARAPLAAALAGLVAVNDVLLATRNLPPLYRSGVRYRREAGTEDWSTAPVVLKRGFGDCEDLAAWRAAELRKLGIPANAIVKRTGPRMFHAVVQWPDGRIEDPSKVLGMKGRS